MTVRAHSSPHTDADAFDHLLGALDALDIRLSLEGDRLRCDAPRGSLTPELRDALAAFRDQLLQHLARESAPIPRVERGLALPLSPAQGRLWLLDRLEGGTPRYNLLAATRVTGPLDAELVAWAIQALVDRHEILRTRFVMLDGEIIQIPLDACGVAVVVEDRSRGPQTDEAAVVAGVFHEESRVVFDLANPPLIRIRLLRFAADVHVLIVNQHHILTDVWSLDVFARDFTMLYAARLQAPPALPALEPLSIQYADYAAWQRGSVGGERLRRGLAFWTRELDGLPLLLPLPIDFARPATLTYRGSAVAVRVPQSVVLELQRIGRESGASLFMVLLTALSVVLSRMSGSRDLAIGVPVSNRPRPELEGLIGFFINSVVMRCRIDGTVSFRALIASNRDTVLAAFAHQDTPFEKLVEALHVRRDLSYAPIFQVMLSFMNRTRELDTAITPFKTEPLQIPQQHALFELDWQLRETTDGVAGFLIYASDLFAPATAAGLVRRFNAFLERVCDNPDEIVDAIDVLTIDERRDLIETWNATAADYPEGRGVHELFEDQAHRTPDAIAITRAGTSWTYQRLDDESRVVAAGLLQWGVTAGALVGVCMDRSPWMVAALLGVLKAGAAYVPLDPGFPPGRIAFMAAGAGLVLTLIDDAVAPALRASLTNVAPVISVNGLSSAASGREPRVPPVRQSATTEPASATMYVIFTSGSTGRPKGVVISHRAVVNFLWSMRREPGLTSDDSLLALTTLSFDIAVLELFLPLIVGARVVLASRDDAADPHRLMRLIEAESITVMQATPSTWRMLLAANWPGSRRLTMLCGGEALPRDLSRALRPRGRALWNMYGPTETAVWSAIRRIPELDDDGATGTESIGRPIANTQIFIVSPDVRLVPAGAIGELCIGGAGLADGYLHRPDLTAERFVPNPFDDRPGSRLYRTGDRVRLKTDGTIECLGRFDEQVKLRGFRIELGEIEFALSRHAGIDQCVVMIREDAPGDPRLVAYYVVAASGVDVDMAEVRGELRQVLPEYMMPAAFVRIDHLPLTPNGKVDRSALPRPDVVAAGADASAAADPPSEIETAIAAMWEDVLGIKHPGRDANFFDLGGHSLLIIRVHQRLTAQLGASCDVLDLFRYPTIRQQAALVAGAGPRRNVRAEAAVQAKRQQQALARQRSLAAARAKT